MYLLYRFVIRRAAQRAIIGRNRDRSQPDRGRFTGPEVNRFVNLAWNKYQGVIPTLPSEPTRGSRMNVQLAALTISLFQVLLETGIERTYALNSFQI